MENLLLFLGLPLSSFFIYLAVCRIERGKQERFNSFNSLYKGEKFEKLGEYEEKSKQRYFSKSKSKTDDG